VSLSLGISLRLALECADEKPHGVVVFGGRLARISGVR
jgi:hypothetical protein